MRLFPAILFVCLLGGCVGELMRPVATARELASEILACEDVEVREAADDTWSTEQTEQRAFLVSGCEREAWVVCRGSFEAQGSCEARPYGPYASPAEHEPHAFLLTTAEVPSGRDYAVNEVLSFDARGWIERPAGESPVIPIRPGLQEITYDATLTQSRHWTESSYTLRNGVRQLDYTSERMAVSTEAVCETRFSLSPEAGALYAMWVEFETGACSLHCRQYATSAAGLVESRCPGFYADVNLVER